MLGGVVSTLQDSIEILLLKKRLTKYTNKGGVKAEWGTTDTFIFNRGIYLV